MKGSYDQYRDRGSRDVADKWLERAVTDVIVGSDLEEMWTEGYVRRGRVMTNTGVEKSRDTAGGELEHASADIKVGAVLEENWAVMGELLRVL